MKRIFTTTTNKIKLAFNGDFEAITKAHTKTTGIHGLDESFTSSELDNILPADIDLKERYKGYPTGEHPDYSFLKDTNSFVKNESISVFIDTKGSTNLFKRHQPEVLMHVFKLILSESIDICHYYGGYVQRLQGDGVFLYFGGYKTDSIQNLSHAIKACSMISFFAQSELNESLEHLGVENISIRTGIDFGNNDDTIWSCMGTSESKEITTTGLHTNLAPKMQSYAPKNGIMVGENVFNKLPYINQYCDYIRNEEGNIDESKQHIFKDRDNNYYYDQKVFNWRSFLNDNSQEFSLERGKIQLLSKPELDKKNTNSRSKIYTTTMSFNKPDSSSNLLYDKPKEQTYFSRGNREALIGIIGNNKPYSKRRNEF